MVALVALWVAFGVGVVGTGGIALCITWIIKDLSVMCYNKVFHVIEGDLKKFEKWAKSNNLDVDKAAKDIESGKVAKPENKADDEQKMAAESLVGALAKGAAKLIGKGVSKSAGKGAAKAATKGATTIAGKAASKLAPAASKGLTKVGSKALKSIAKLSPKTAEVLKKGATELGKVLKKNGITMEYALGKVGDYMANAYEKASNEDKKILDVMKEDLDSATDVDNLMEKLGELFDVMNNGDAKSDEVVKESKQRWIPLN